MKNGFRRPLAGLALLAVCAIASAAEVERTISVTGEALIHITPDVADVAIGVETFAATPEEVTARNDAAVRTMLAAIRAQGVEERHIRTQELKLEIRYRDGEPYKGVTGYLARREYMIKVTAVANGCHRFRGAFPRREPAARRRLSQQRPPHVSRPGAPARGESGEGEGRPDGCRIG